MYFLLTLHNLVRWLVLLALVFALYRAWSGFVSKRSWAAMDAKAIMAMSVLIDIQALFGIVLALGKGFGNLGSFLMDHVIPMVLALIFAHVGSAQIKKAAGDAQFKKAALWVTITFLIVLVAIPWARPLFRL